jgi:tetratricopeptide (TPR) repeat protein
MAPPSELSLADALVAEFRSNPNRIFSEPEAAALAAVADRDIWAAKASALHCFRQGDVSGALAFARSVADREPNSESVKNVAVALLQLGQYEEAAAWIEERQALLAPIQYHDLLCAHYAKLGKLAEAVAHGDQALLLKDESEPAQDPPSPIVRPFDVERRSRNVIAFSIWGTNIRYLKGAVTNAIVARYLYPGWTARFYTDQSTPAGFLDELKRNGAEVVQIDDLEANRFGLFWRFLVEDDPEVDLYLVRDADAVMNVKERWAVADWLSSGKAFHVMRDSPQHSELMLAGLWGAHRGNIGDMRRRIEGAVAAGRSIANYINHDQHFLRAEIWPVVRNSVKIHDAYFSFMSPTRFSPDFPLPRQIHVGQNDWVNFRQTPP